MNVQLAIQILAVLLLAAGLGLWQSGFVRERSIWRTGLEMLVRLGVAGLVAGLALVWYQRQAASHFDLNLVLVFALIAATPLTSLAGRIRPIPGVLLAAIFAAPLIALSYPFSFPPFGLGAAGLGALFVIGARRTEAPSNLPAVAGGVLVFLLGVALITALTVSAQAQLIAHEMLNTVLGLAAAAPLVWLLRKRTIAYALPGAVAAALVSWNADAARPEAMVAALVAGGLTALIGAALTRARIDDATGAVSAFIAAGIAWLFVPLRFDSAQYLAGLPAILLPLCAILLIGTLFGFLAALFLQITIGLRAPEQSGEIAPEVVKPR